MVAAPHDGPPNAGRYPKAVPCCPYLRGPFQIRIPAVQEFHSYLLVAEHTEHPDQCILCTRRTPSNEDVGSSGDHYLFAPLKGTHHTRIFDFGQQRRPALVRTRSSLSFRAAIRGSTVGVPILTNA